jgi:hypothetical protein
MRFQNKTTFFQLSITSQTLQTQSFLQGHIRELFQTDPTSFSAWSTFAQSWNDLKLDGYMGDGGTYRLRRFSEFHLEQPTGTLQLLSHRPYRQSREDNRLNGGDGSTVLASGG